MLDVRQVASRARAVQAAAPFPSTFVTLVRMLLATMAELIDDFNKRSESVRTTNAYWKPVAQAYRERLLDYQTAAQTIIDHKASGSEDWQAGLVAGSEYAKALDRFYYAKKPDVSLWANLSNDLEAMPGPPKEVIDPKSGTVSALKWAAFLGATWPVAISVSVSTIAAKGLADWAGVTDEEVSKAFDDATDFVKETASSLVKAILIGAGLYFLLKD